jgi:hypothetical protein
MRSRVISVIAISLIGFTPQIALAKQTYTLQQYPEGFADANVPCSAFKRAANGAWKEVAVFVFHDVLLRERIPENFTLLAAASETSVQSKEIT